MRLKNISILLLVIMFIVSLSSFANALSDNSIEFNQSVYDGNDALAMWLMDLSYNTSTAPSQDYINVTINSSSGGEVTFTLNETTNISGVFNYSFYGFALNLTEVTNTLTANFSTAAGSSDNHTGTLQISAGDHIWVSYHLGSYSSSAIINTSIAVIEETGTINASVGESTLIPFTINITSANGLIFNVQDMGKNLDVNAVDNISIQVLNTRSGDSLMMSFNESGVDTGIFNVLTNGTGDDGDESNFRFNFACAQGCTPTANSEANNDLLVQAGDKINITYNDNQNFNGDDPAIVQDYVWMDMDGFYNFTTNSNINTNFGPNTNCSGNLFIYVNDTGRDTDEDTIQNLSVTLSSSVGSITVILNESGANTGVFNTTHNSSGVAPTAVTLSCTSDESDNESYILSVAENDIVTLTYDDNQNFSGENPAATSKTISIADNGTISLDQAVYNQNGNPTITITDFDLNTSSTVADQINVSLYSTTEGSTPPITVTLNESGLSTGIFNITVNWTAAAGTEATWIINLTNRTSSTNLSGTQYILNVTAGDWFNISYTDANPSVVRWASAKIQTDATVVFNATTSSSLYNATSIIGIKVTDNGSNQDGGSVEQITVYLNSTSDSTGFAITLNESGADTGVFEVLNDSENFNINFSTTATDSATYTLQVAEGDKVMVRFEDTQFAGTNVNATDSANISSTATISFDAAGYTANSNPLITVTDADANKNSGVMDQLNVTLYSTTEGSVAAITVTLNESALNSSIFNITVNWTAGGSWAINLTNRTSSNDTAKSQYTLNVSQGDIIRVNYTDAAPAGQRTTTAKIQTDATVVFNGTVAGSLYNVTSPVGIFVTDNGTNQDSSAIEQITVYLNSTSDSTGFAITLNETGVDTGIFYILNDSANFNINFSTSATNSATYTLQVAEGDKVMVRFDDTTFEGANSNVTDFANISSTGTISFDASIYAYNDNPVITVTDADLNVNATLADQINVTLYSTTEGSVAAITVTLNESGLNSSIFNITVNQTGGFSWVINLTNEGNSSNTSDSQYRLNITAGDILKVNYTDAAPGGYASATARMDQTGAIMFYRVSYNMSATPTIKIDDHGANSDQSAVDQLSVTLNSTEWPSGLTVLLNESGVDTGIFNISDVAIDFTASSAGSDATNTLNVSYGGTIWVSYSDTQTATAGSTGVAIDYAPIYGMGTVAFGKTSYNSTARPIITVTDNDRNQNKSVIETVSVQLYGDTDPNGITVYLNESSVDSGIFNFSVNASLDYKEIFFNTSSGEANNTLGYTAGDTLVARYDDTNNTQGVPQNTSTDSVINIQVTKNKGWQTFSVPLTLADTTVSTTFGSVSYNVIYEYNGATGEFSNLVTTGTLSPLKGYVINMSSKDTITFTPIKSWRAPSVVSNTVPSLQLYNGFNLIGINNISTSDIYGITASLYNSGGGGSKTWTHMIEPINSTTYLNTFAGSSVLSVGAGYWIYVTENGSHARYTGLQR